MGTSSETPFTVRLSARAAALAATLVLAAAAAAQESPNRVVASAADELAAQLAERRSELAADREALYEVVDDIILPRFDRRYAGQLVLGRHWRDASEAQREDFVDALYNNLLQKYADAVLEFDQDRVEILPFRGDESKPRVTVRSRVRLDDGTEVPVDYSLVRRESGWKVFDVIIEGISYVRNFRAEVNSEIQQSNLDAVISRLESETSAQSSQSGSE